MTYIGLSYICPIQGLTPRLYTELLHLNNNILKTQLIEIQAKGLNRHVTKYSNVERCSISSVIREMQIKTVKVYTIPLPEKLKVRPKQIKQ